MPCIFSPFLTVADGHNKLGVDLFNQELTQCFVNHFIYGVTQNCLGCTGQEQNLFIVCLFSLPCVLLNLVFPVILHSFIINCPI
jgi:hypothetical protein